MSLYRINNPVDLERQEVVSSLALVSMMYPESKVSSKGVDYIHFGDGKRNAFVTTRGMSREEFVNNITNLCKSNLLNAQEYLMPYVEGKAFERDVYQRVYAAVLEKHKELPESVINVMTKRVENNVALYDKAAYDMKVDVNVRNGVKNSVEGFLGSLNRYASNKRINAHLAISKAEAEEPGAGGK